MRRHKPVVVEFIGLPGSGKTFLATQLLSMLDQQGCLAKSDTLRINGASRAGRVARKAAAVGRILIRRPHLAWAVKVFVRRSGNEKRSRRFILLWNWLYLLGVMDRSGPRKECIVLDQGVFQAFWATWRDSLAPPILGDALFCADRLFQILGSPRVIVVVVSASMQTREERLAWRRRQARDPASDETNSDFGLATSSTAAILDSLRDRRVIDDVLYVSTDSGPRSEEAGSIVLERVMARIVN